MAMKRFLDKNKGLLGGKSKPDESVDKSMSRDLITKIEDMQRTTL